MKIGQAGLLAVLTTLALAAPARADVQWAVNATFADGGTLSGSFTMNLSGYISAASLTSTEGNGTTYTLPSTGEYMSSDANWISLQIGYSDVLYLAFASPINGAPSIVSLTSQSYQCQGSSWCFDANNMTDPNYAGPATLPTDRFLSGTATGTTIDSTPYDGPSGDSSVPEPASWAMMVAGFAAIGGAVRYRRRAALLM